MIYNVALVFAIQQSESVIYMHVSTLSESACNAGDLGLIPGSGKFPAEGNGNPLQYSCLENPMDRGASKATVMGSQESDMT